VEEARIGGQLQHPGIVPVYELGRFPDLRPYFTMKLVKGRTLAEHLKARPDLSHDRARFLTIFEQVCQTVAYAHSKGVIHRDLKPGNVMVGAFGEVQVMDWGLAKVLSRPADGGGTAVLSSPATGTDGQTGVIGTPDYMPPEQARGEAEAVDERADVFGLGGILCTVLTGKPPFVAAAADELLQDVAAGKRSKEAARARIAAAVRRKAENGDLSETFARLDACGADADSVTLAKACLAPRPEDRPRDAGVVAARMADYQAAMQERLRKAELERVAAEARAAEERRRRRAQLALGATLLLLIAVGGGGAWWTVQERQARAAEALRLQAKADAATQRALDEARLLLDQARSDPLGEAGQFDRALTAARQAEEVARTGGASAESEQQARALVEVVQAERDDNQRDRRLLTDLTAVRGPREGPQFRTDDEGFVVVLAEPSTEDQFQAAFRAWDAAFDVDRLSTAEAAALLQRRPRPVVTEVIAALDEWASERRRRGASAAAWRRVTDLAAMLDETGSRRAELRTLMARDDVQEGRARLRELAETTDAAGEPVLGLLTLLQALRAAGEDALAEQVLRSALRARPREVVLYDALGKLLERRRPPRWREAAECFAVARALRPELGEALAYALVRSGQATEGFALYDQLVVERKDNPWLHGRRAFALTQQGRYDQGEAAAREAVRLLPEYPTAHNTLGTALGGQGRWNEAEPSYREAIRQKADFAEAHYNLGVALHHLRRYKEAEGADREALRLRPDYPEAHVNLGAALEEQGRHREAEAEFRRTIRLKPDFAPAHYNLGNSLDHQGRRKPAEDAYREAIRLNPDFARAHASLGDTLYRLGRLKEAEDAYREAIRHKPDLARAHDGLGSVLGSQGRNREAEAALREAIRLKPDFAQAHNNLGAALHQQGRYKEAEAEFREALRFKPDYPSAHNNLGAALDRQGRHAEAEKSLREAVRLKPDYVEAHDNLGMAVGSQGRLKEAEASHREAIRLQSDYAKAHCNLGHVLREQGRFVEALASMRRGHTLGNARPNWRYPSAGWVRECEHLVEVDRKLSLVLQGTAEPAGTAEYLELARLCQKYKKLPVAATRFYADAFAADPKLADDPTQQHRYNAVRCAGRAAGAQGDDAVRLPDKATQMLRRQALSWLRADLVALARLAQGGATDRQTVRQRVAQQQQEPDLASLRDAPALAKLPEEERKQWSQLWDDAAALLMRVGEKK
jgi:serine/threonine-protein kinase